MVHHPMNITLACVHFHKLQYKLIYTNSISNVLILNNSNTLNNIAILTGHNYLPHIK